MSAINIRITGFVQGVFFRAETKRFAEGLGVKGWVRNCDDGSVEIHAEGSEHQLEELEQWCQKGPPAARVEKVEVKSVPEEKHATFEILS